MDLSKMRTRIQKTESGPLLRQGAQKRSRRLAIGYKRVRGFAQIICATSADTAAQLVRLYRQRITSYYLPPYGVFSFNLPLGKTIQPVTKETSPGLCFLGIVTRILILCLRISNFPKVYSPEECFTVACRSISSFNHSESAIVYPQLSND